MAVAPLTLGDHLGRVHSSNDNDIEQTAAALGARHGSRARQQVVDQIIAAIRAHDLATAKRWDEIGEAVDRRLAA
ncbi:hypothetical protein KZ820_12225 [Sphingomonas sp. RRHST34]|uniref:Uncharacterized protein n=1 Tax=Sphingomonas citri TaxID=2862499 RepID=A0ABS7BPH0_9SPHN|nr:hypothetical protein [Sphingomonas citri]